MARRSKKGRRRKPKCAGAVKRKTRAGTRWYCPTGKRRRKRRSRTRR